MGISIKKKERLNSDDGRDLKFGVVITLKELNGINRIQDFIQKCQFRGCLVHRIDYRVKLIFIMLPKKK